MENTTRGTPSPASSFPTNGGDATLKKAATGAHAAVDRVASAADEAARSAKPAIDRVAQMAHQALDTVAEKGEDLTSAQRKLMAQTCEYIAANPMKSVGIALVAGFLLSKIIL